MHEGEIVKQIRLLQGLSQEGAGKEMNISQQAFAKLEKKEAIKEAQLSVVLKALGSSQKEFEIFKDLLYPPPEK